MALAPTSLLPRQRSSDFESSNVEGSTITTHSGNNNVINITNNNNFYPTPYDSTTSISQSSEHISPTNRTKKTMPQRKSDVFEMAPAVMTRLPSIPEDEDSPQTVTTAMTTESKHKCKIKARERAGIEIKSDPRIETYMRSKLFTNPKVIPLWWPSPDRSLHENFQKNNICIGDVGSFDDEGKFEVRFNIFLSASDNIARGSLEVPEKFSPYPVSGEISSVDTISRYDYRRCCGGFSEAKLGSSESPLTPDREYIAEYSFKSGKGGAILNLPDEAWKDRISNMKLKKMRSYFDNNAESWYEDYEKKHGYPIANGSLMIVNCTYKTKTWALAICSSKTSSIYARVYKKRQNTDLYEWETHTKVEGRTGPELERFGEETTDLWNQCVAVEVSSIKLSTGSRGVKSVNNLTRVFSQSFRSFNSIFSH